MKGFNQIQNFIITKMKRIKFTWSLCLICMYLSWIAKMLNDECR